jgi:tRNA U34 5-methylaminomethyl-2-thiouridine-forming methyltransferase MnmC
MSDNLQIITTSDGSHSLLNTTLNETYHSHHGALQESLHVFIKHGLEYFHHKFHAQSIRVFEVGFGTGLNALLTLQFVLKNKVPVEYTSIEAYPLGEDVWSRLNYAQALDMQEQFKELHKAGWNEWQNIPVNFRLKKLNTTLQNIVLDQQFEVIYFDAFAPNKQPEMWQLPLLEKVANTLTVNGVFVTYCAKGQVKRDLKSLGLVVETLPGPPGKKEMVRALKI